MNERLFGKPEGFLLCAHSSSAGQSTGLRKRNPKQSTNTEELIMAFFNSAVGVLQTLVVALGAGLGIWGAINLMEGYGNDNPGSNAHVR